MPSQGLPGPRRLIAALGADLARGDFRPDLVEASLALGQPEFRLIVNPAADSDRRHAVRPVLVLLQALSLGSAAARETVLEWVSARGREVYFGLAQSRHSSRQKLYFADRRPGGRDFALPLRRFQAPGFLQRERLPLLGIDFRAGEPVAFKAYRPAEVGDLGRYRSGRLLAFLGAQGLDPGRRTVHLCRRYDPGGGLWDESLHVQVDDLADPLCGGAYARFVGAERDAALLAEFHERIPIRTRVLSETLGSERGRHVYFAPTGPGRP